MPKVPGAEIRYTMKGNWFPLDRLSCHCHPRGILPDKTDHFLILAFFQVSSSRIAGSWQEQCRPKLIYAGLTPV
jgi:hypothetical protein